VWHFYRFLLEFADPRSKIWEAEQKKELKGKDLGIASMMKEYLRDIYKLADS